jgi:hypothetical protein
MFYLRIYRYLALGSEIGTEVTSAPVDMATVITRARLLAGAEALAGVMERSNPYPMTSSLWEIASAAYPHSFLASQ